MLPAKIPATSKSATQQPQLNRDDQSQIPSPNAGAFSNTNPRNGPFIVVVHGAEDTITRPPSQFILPDKENLPTLKLKDEPPDGGHATQPPDTFRAPVNPSFGRDRTMLKMKKKSRLKNAPSHTTYRKRVTNRVLHQSRSSTFESTHQASDSVCKDFLDMFSILQVLKNGELIKLVDTTPEYQNLFGSVANLLRVLLDKWGAAKHMTELQWQLMKDFINKYIRETAKKTCFDDLRNVAPQLSVPVESLPIIEIEEDEEEEEQDPSQLGETPALAYNQHTLEDVAPSPTNQRTTESYIQRIPPMGSNVSQDVPDFIHDVSSEDEMVSSVSSSSYLDYKLPQFPDHVERALKADKPLPLHIRRETINIAFYHLLSFTTNLSPLYKHFAEQMIYHYPNLAKKGLMQAKKMWRNLLKYKNKNSRQRNKKLSRISSITSGMESHLSYEAASSGYDSASQQQQQYRNSMAEPAGGRNSWTIHMERSNMDEARQLEAHLNWMQTERREGEGERSYLPLEVSCTEGMAKPMLQSWELDSAHPVESRQRYLEETSSCSS